MREFKFRAWDEQRKSFFTHPNWVEFTIDRFGILKAKNFNTPMCGRGYKELVVCQYTGVKDKNNVEIYEGDIINIEGNKRDVYFEHGCFWVRHNGELHIHVLGEKLRYKVIGNIYENKELLGEQHE